jgi:hypothetical protein
MSTGLTMTPQAHKPNSYMVNTVSEQRATCLVTWHLHKQILITCVIKDLRKTQ